MTIERHEKVWGEEYWIVNKDYCGKLLKLKCGFRCSFHWHDKKDEVFYISRGIVLMESRRGEFSRKVVLHTGDKFEVPPGLVHRFTGIVDSDIYEFSSHHDDNDSFRETKSEQVPEHEFNEVLAFAFKNKKMLMAMDSAISVEENYLANLKGLQKALQWV